MARPTIRVAIMGGGLAGTLLMNALIRYPQLDVQLYEAKSEIQERGASIGLSINAQRAMRLLGFEDVTRRANAVKVGCLQLLVETRPKKTKSSIKLTNWPLVSKGEGPDAGKLIYDVDFGKETVHRAALLRELLAPIRKDSIHLGRRLVSIQDHTIIFDDGSKVEADVIIGADGIHSVVRKFVLGEGNGQIAPVPSGFWDTRAIVSYNEAVAKLGISCINKDDPHQHIHIGRKAIILHDFIDDGKNLCIVASGPVTHDFDLSKWTHVLSQKWLSEQYAGWGDYGRDVLDLLLGNKEELPAFIHWESAKAHTLYNGTICMIGDAAHACSPWQGSGLSQAIEDSLILERVLGRCQDVGEVPLALQAFDLVRRQHAQEVVDSSRRAAESYFSAWAGGVEQLRRDIPSRQYILDWDTEGAVNDAIKRFEELKLPNGVRDGID